MVDVADKLAYFQALKMPICVRRSSRLMAGISKSPSPPSHLRSLAKTLHLPAAAIALPSPHGGVAGHGLTDYPSAGIVDGDELAPDPGGTISGEGGPPGAVWRIITLPISSLILYRKGSWTRFSDLGAHHPDAPGFCERTLGNEAFAAFVNKNFVSWGGSIRASEGFKMSNSLKASRFPFCAVVMPAADQRIALLLQVEGPRTPEKMLALLQRVVEDSSHVLVTARVEAEERRNNMRLREEQDAAYRAALEADQARERQRREEEERLEREAAEAERQRKEEEEARERAEREAAEREAARVRMGGENAIALRDEPDKGSDITQVLVRFPNGERKETEEYSLISNFPRIVYSRDKLLTSLKDAGLHPQASLFIELN
ncbi:hypothetical protein EUTSA_v10025495mg [Eutrema salsugineum]|uniref:UAS domain-containing protein n=1 Tax=Eutrema salsugineum TaxID=72664 RepID=V4MHY2_EUTSA|nr:hypothetical protein EUTSA_v10025495mg [Eutrema salsugineum]